MKEKAHGSVTQQQLRQIDWGSGWSVQVDRIIGAFIDTPVSGERERERDRGIKFQILFISWSFNWKLCQHRKLKKDKKRREIIDD